MTDRIYGFEGPYHFLSNFFIEADGLSGEHRFQASKAVEEKERDWVLAAKTPGQAKGRGRNVKLVPDWDDVKVGVMLAVVQYKFQDPHLAKMLLDTGYLELIEANTWGDRYWGVDKETGEGQNYLGRCLMHVRTELRTGERTL
jgi:ribA/ribD-fused uncharacterized protein